MNIKPFLNDVKDFIIDLVLELVETGYNQAKDIFNVLTRNKRFWIYAWFILFCVSSFVGNKKVRMVSLIMFVAFFVAYRWQRGDFRHRAREKLKKKAKELGLKRRC